MNIRDEMDFATRIIRSAAARMVGSVGLTEADIPDVQQDLWLELLTRLPKYRAERGSPRAFITLVVRNKRASILKARSAEKRGSGCLCVSLNTEIESDDSGVAELQDCISVDDYLRRTRSVERSEEEKQDLALDLRTLIGSLQPRDSVICLLLIDQEVSSIANVVGMPRSTLRDLIKRLRQTAESWGIQEYFRRTRHSDDGSGK